MTAILLEVSGLSVRYGEFEAVTDASIAIPEGQTLALVGESGSGKSSLAARSVSATSMSAGSPDPRCGRRAGVSSATSRRTRWRPSTRC